MDSIKLLSLITSMTMMMEALQLIVRFLRMELNHQEMLWRESKQRRLIELQIGDISKSQCSPRRGTLTMKKNHRFLLEVHASSSLTHYNQVIQSLLQVLATMMYPNFLATNLSFYPILRHLLNSPSRRLLETLRQQASIQVSRKPSERHSSLFWTGRLYLLELVTIMLK